MEWVLLGISLLLILGTGLFVAAEFSLVTIDRATVEAAADAGDKGQARVLRALTHLSTNLSGAQIGITITTLLTGYLMEPSLARLLAEPFESWGVAPSAVEPVTLVVAMVVATVLSMVVGELVPKNLTIARPLQVARRIVPFQLASTAVMRPLIAVLGGAANSVLHVLRIEPAEELGSARTAEELSSLVRRSAQEGTLDAGTATLLSRSLAISEQTAADVMTPRQTTATIGREQTADELIAMARATGFSRFPVIRDDIDDVVGVVHVKKAVAVPRDRRDQVPVSALMSEVVRVPETLGVEQLLVALRGQSLQLAVVVDEYGGTSGIATLEDVVEEVVGEVADEHDRVRGGARRLRDGSWNLPGLMRPDEIRRQMGVDVPEDPSYETVAGFVMAVLGRIPRVGDHVEVDGARLSVERMDGRRVDRLRLIVSGPGTVGAGGERRRA